MELVDPVRDVDGGACGLAERREEGREGEALVHGDPGLVDEVGDADDGPGGERMAAAQGEHERLARERHDLDLSDRPRARAGGPMRDDEVGGRREPGEAVELDVLVAQAHRWSARVGLAQQRREPRERRTVEGRDGDGLRVRRVVDLGEGEPGAGHRVGDVAGGAGEPLARRGEQEPPALAAGQGATGRGLQGSELLRDGRRGEPEHGGGGRDGALVAQFAQREELVDLHTAMLMTHVINHRWCYRLTAASIGR